MGDRSPRVSGMKEKMKSGMTEMKSEADKLASYPKTSTAHCPKRFERVAPKPKIAEVNPTNRKRVHTLDIEDRYQPTIQSIYLLRRLNRPEPNVISATRNG